MVKKQFRITETRTVFISAFIEAETLAEANNIWEEECEDSDKVSDFNETVESSENLSIVECEEEDELDEDAYMEVYDEHFENLNY